MKLKKKNKPYVRFDTVLNGVGVGLNNPGESRICKVGKYQVLLTRGKKLDSSGNPIHTACLVKKGKTVGRSAKSNGYVPFIVSKMFNRNGIEVKK